MSWKTEFNEEYSVPKWLEESADWLDVSWHNDACPSFQSIHNEALRVWCEHPEQMQRESPYSTRFYVYESDTDAGFSTDNEEELQDFLRKTLKKP